MTVSAMAIIMASRAVNSRSPTIVNSSVGRTREYFTPAEIERLIATARKPAAMAITMQP